MLDSGRDLRSLNPRDLTMLGRAGSWTGKLGRFLASYLLNPYKHSVTNLSEPPSKAII